MADDLFSSFANKSVGESVVSAPEGYAPGKAKYLIVVGTVISGLGKGIAMSALGRILKSQGLRVSPIKFDGYLNVDAGTLNPFRHGEVFVLDDGTECDMDLGTYERFLDQDISKMNYMTSGRLFKTIIDKERAGKYLGRDVQFIPHVTGEIKHRVRELAMKSDADVVLIEIGGTAGDIENSFVIEAMRQLRHEEGPENVAVLALTYIVKPSALGEQKSKAAQLGMRTLMGLGLMPDFIGCRSEEPVEGKIKEKLSVASNMPMSNVIDMHNESNIYDVVLGLERQGVHRLVLGKFGLKAREPDLESWRAFSKKVKATEGKITVGVSGKYTQLKDAYASIIESLNLAGVENNIHVDIRWIDASDDGAVDKEMGGIDGLIVPGGFGARGVEGKIRAVKYARENKVPFLGLCYGFQMAVIDHARNVLGMPSANSTEVDPETEFPVIDLLPEQKGANGAGGTLRLGGQDVTISEGTKAHAVYGKTNVRERFRHRYECNPDYIGRLQTRGLVFSGYAPGKRIMQILERDDHPFFMASQFHPEFTGRPMKPNPLFNAFVRACAERK